MNTQQNIQEHYISDAMHQMSMSAPANASVVGRTQRVVRAQMRDAQAQQRKLRAVLLPMAFCTAMIILIVYSAWQMLVQYAEIITDGVESLPENSMMLGLLTLSFLPLSMGVMMMIWLRRSRRL